MQECSQFWKKLQSFQMWQSVVFKCMYRNFYWCQHFSLRKCSPVPNVSLLSQKRPQAKFCKVSCIYYFLLAVVNNQHIQCMMKQLYIFT